MIEGLASSSTELHIHCVEESWIQVVACGLRDRIHPVLLRVKNHEGIGMFLEEGKGDASCLGPLAGLEKQRTQYKAAVEALADPLRTRKLLLNKRELEKITTAVQQKGFACVALAIYWKQHLIKCEIGLGKGKKEYDKRNTEKERDSDREVARAMRH